MGNSYNRAMNRGSTRSAQDNVAHLRGTVKQSESSAFMEAVKPLREAGVGVKPKPVEVQDLRVVVYDSRITEPLDKTTREPRTHEIVLRGTTTITRGVASGGHHVLHVDPQAGGAFKVSVKESGRLAVPSWVAH